MGRKQKGVLELAGELLPKGQKGFQVFGESHVPRGHIHRSRLQPAAEGGSPEHKKGKSKKSAPFIQISFRPSPPPQLKQISKA